MSFTAYATATVGQVLTAAFWNAQVRDNGNLTPAALATTAGYMFFATGTNAIEEADPTDGSKLDGDHLDIDYTPTNYTPSASPAEAADADDLAAHLAGIDDELGDLDSTTIVTGSRTAAAGSGVQNVTGAGFAPTWCLIVAMESGSVARSWGFVDDANAEESLQVNAGGGTGINATVVDISDGSDGMSAVATLTSDGVDLTWTKVSSGMDVSYAILFGR